MARRRLWLMAFALALALVAGACGDDGGDEAGGGGEQTEATSAPEEPPTFAAGSTMDNLQKRGRIVVGTKFDQPLFGQKNPLNNELEGFDVEIAKLVSQGIFGADIEGKVEFVESASKNREPFIQEGKVAMVVATYTINDTRKQVVDFAGPYYIAGQDILVKKDNQTIKGVEDLNGKKVCSVQGSTSIVNVQQKAPQADLSTSFDQYSKCVAALADGRVEAVTTDDVILLGFVADQPDELRVVGRTFTEEPYGIGIKKGDTAFRNFINDRLEEIYESGEWRRAFEATVGKAGEEAPEPPALDRY